MQKYLDVLRETDFLSYFCRITQKTFTDIENIMCQKKKNNGIAFLTLQVYNL